MMPSVDLPAPFGPMIACTSPGRTVRLSPLRMSLPATRAWRLSILSMGECRRKSERNVGGRIPDRERASRGSAARAFERDAAARAGGVGDLEALHVVGAREVGQGGARDFDGAVGEAARRRG